MKIKNKALWTVVLLAMFGPELITGSTQLFMFASLFQWIILFLGYGLAVLVIRELAVRMRLNLWGAYLLGMAFTVVNEGLAAKTMILESSLPVAQYDYYGYFAGISFPWMFGISIWHALASVLLPIVVSYYLFPEYSEERWLGNKLLGAISLLVMVAASLIFFSSAVKVKGTAPQYIILLCVMAFWFAVARMFGRNKNIFKKEQFVRPGLKPFFLGLSVLVPLSIGLSTLAAAKIFLPLFFVFLALIVWFYAHILRQKGWTNPAGLVMFGLGFYVQQGLLTLLQGIARTNIILAGTEIILVMVLIFLSLRMKKLEQLPLVSP
ncbi:MAG: hypothetical protein WC794_03935 [Candidatus Doudnabacteria bacterium]|jgi:hypothetical protein